MKPKKDANADKAKRIAKRAELAAKGINLRELCAANNINYQTVRDILRGRSKGRRGEAHRAAVFLGLKPNPDQLSA